MPNIHQKNNTNEEIKAKIKAIIVSNAFDGGDNTSLIEQIKSVDGINEFATALRLTLPNLAGVLAPFCALNPSVNLRVQTKEKYQEEIAGNSKLRNLIEEIQQELENHQSLENSIKLEDLKRKLKINELNKNPFANQGIKGVFSGIFASIADNVVLLIANSVPISAAASTILNFTASVSGLISGAILLPSQILMSIYGKRKKKAGEIMQKELDTQASLLNNDPSKEENSKNTTPDKIREILSKEKKFVDEHSRKYGKKTQIGQYFMVAGTLAGMGLGIVGLVGLFTAAPITIPIAVTIAVLLPIFIPGTILNLSAAIRRSVFENKEKIYKGDYEAINNAVADNLGQLLDHDTGVDQNHNDEKFKSVSSLIDKIDTNLAIIKALSIVSRILNSNDKPEEIKDKFEEIKSRLSFKRTKLAWNSDTPLKIEKQERFKLTKGRTRFANWIYRKGALNGLNLASAGLLKNRIQKHADNIENNMLRSNLDQSVLLQTLSTLNKIGIENDLLDQLMAMPKADANQLILEIVENACNLQYDDNLDLAPARDNTGASVPNPYLVPGAAIKNGKFYLKNLRFQLKEKYIELNKVAKCQSDDQKSLDRMVSPIQSDNILEEGTRPGTHTDYPISKNKPKTKINP